MLLGGIKNCAMLELGRVTNTLNQNAHTLDFVEHV